MRNFGLIGYPLTHSFSEKYFSEKFKSENIPDCRYHNYQLDTIDRFEELLKKVEPEGLNVTIPYKEKVIPFLDKLSSAAKEIGAVNCIRFLNGERIGYNTDVIGFKDSLMPLIKDKKPDKALILGTGGASKAIAHVLQSLDIQINFVSRRVIKNGYAYEEITKDIIQQNQLIVNTTPLGTFPAVETKPDIPYQFLNKNHILYDLVYNPAETVFLSLGKKHGAVIKNGYEMLVGQAEASWEIWNDAG